MTLIAPLPRGEKSPPHPRPLSPEARGEQDTLPDGRGSVSGEDTPRLAALRTPFASGRATQQASPLKIPPRFGALRTPFADSGRATQRTGLGKKHQTGRRCPPHPQPLSPEGRGEKETFPDGRGSAKRAP